MNHTKIEVKEHPIIFSTDMVRAILEGRKTQTRRVIKPQPTWEERNQDFHIGTGWHWEYKTTILNAWESVDEFTQQLTHFCPYGQVGQRLWVKETWYPNPATCTPIYKADYPLEEKPQVWSADAKWKSSLFMPRWASRINLEITGLRVERLQEISPEEWRREGLELVGYEKTKQNYINLWDSLNAKRGYGWEKNPWVWVIEFRRIDESHGD